MTLRPRNALLKQLTDDELLAGAQLELAQVDSTPAQAHPVDFDLGDAPDADEHPAALDRHDEAVDARRRAPTRRGQDHIRHVADLGAVGADQRQPH